MKTERNALIELDPSSFREMGHELVESIAGFLEQIRNKPVTTGKSPAEIQAVIGTEGLPEKGQEPAEILRNATEKLFRDSLFNSHPRFLGYITSSPAPLGILADFLASALNQNMGAQILSPVGTEIEKQTVQWLGEFIGVGTGWGGILVSGGNMANLTAFLAGRKAMVPDEFHEDGIHGLKKKYLTYCARSTHTWIEKATTLFGQGKNSLRWIDTDGSNRMDLASLEAQMLKDREAGHVPMMIVATAGDVSTGAVDDLRSISKICKDQKLWFHVDGAYGAPAAVLPELRSLFDGLDEADSIALDPHKWLYSPLEAGCTLVKDPSSLARTFSSHPEYYNFGLDAESSLNYYEYGMQNSRGFRALKVWISLQQAGRTGYEQMIREDIDLAGYLFRLAEEQEELVAMTCKLSIATFRYVPKTGSGKQRGQELDKMALNELNEALVNRIQKSGDLFLSNAIVDGYYCLRACVVNFRTTRRDMEEIVKDVISMGRELSA